MMPEQTWPLKPGLDEMLPVSLDWVLSEVCETKCVHLNPQPSEPTLCIIVSFTLLKGFYLDLNLVFWLLIIEAIREKL